MQATTSKHRLLLVDGDPKSLRVLNVSLKKAGFEVSTATNGIEALAALESAPDLIISDTHMPEMDGFELCRRIKQRPEWAKIPFIFLSSRKSIEEKIRGLELGVEDYLSKPIYIKEITTRVRMLLQRAQRERLESRRDPRTRFAGQLGDIGVVDLVQTIEINRKSGIIHIVNRDGRRGAIYFRDGQVIDAEAGRLAGPEGLYRLFSWVEGTFEVEFKPIRRKDVVELSPPALLMEGMRRLDEWTRLLEGMPPLDTVFEVDYHLLAERLAELPDEVNGVLRLFDGRRTMLQVIEDCDFPDLEALSIIGKLFGDHLIRESHREPPLPVEGFAPSRLERWLADGSPGEGDERPLSGRSPGDRRSADRDGDDDDQVKPPAWGDVRLAGGGDVIPFPAMASEGETASATAPVEPPTPAPHVIEKARPPAHGYDDRHSPPPPAARDREREHDSPYRPSSTPLSSAISDASANGVAPHRHPTADLPAAKERTAARSPAAPPVSYERNAGLERHAERHHGTPGAPFEVRNAFDGPEDTLVVALRSARRRRAMTIVLGAAVALMLVVVVAVRLTTDARHKAATVASAPAAAPRDPAEPASPAPPAAPVAAAPPAQAPASGNLPPAAPPAATLPPAGSPPPAVAAPAGSPPTAAAASAPPVAAAAPPARPPAAAPAPAPGGPVATPAPAAPAAASPIVAAPAAALRPPPPPAAAPAAAAPAPPAAPPAPPVAPAAPPAAAAAAVPTDDPLRAECRKAYRNGRGAYKAVFDACGAVVKADPQAADAMVILADVELNRGRNKEAGEWAQHALAINPALPEPYAYLGMAELAAGRRSEMRAAFARYLELAPAGKYAADIRAVLKGK